MVFGLDSTSVSILFSIYPVIAVLLLWYIAKRKKSRSVKKDLWFLLGFLAITAFYIFAPDPSLIQKLYVENGDFTPIFEFSTVSAFFLFVAVFYFRKHRRGDEE